jgi:hypothetical protein
LAVGFKVQRDRAHIKNRGPKIKLALIKLASMPAGADTIPLLDSSIMLKPGLDLEVAG